jgi:hypothetical protein
MNLPVTEGTEITTIGRFGQKCANFKSGGTKFSLPIWSAKTYIAKKNKKGVLKWFYKECFGRTIASHKPSEKFIRQVKNDHKNYLPGIIHLKKIKTH